MDEFQEVLSRRGDRGSCRLIKKKAKLVESFFSRYCSSLALAIARKEARDGLVAIPILSSKKEKMKKKRGEKRRLLEENPKVENAEDDEEEEVEARFNYEEGELDRFHSGSQYQGNTHMSTTSLLKVSR